MDIPIPGLNATGKQRASISSDSEAERVSFEYTGDSLFSGHEASGVTISNSGHSLAAQSGREEPDGTATTNRSMDEGLQIENSHHGATLKRCTVLRSCPNGHLVIVDGRTGNVVCTHELRARLYPDVAIKVVGLAVGDSDVKPGGILVARLLDGFGAEFVEVISIDTKNWNTEVLFCGELFESDDSHDAGHIHISRHAQIALLASHRHLVLVDWVGKRIACIKASPSKSFIKVGLLRTYMVLEDRQEHDSKVKGAVPSRSVIVSLANVWKEVASRAFVNQVLLLDNIPSAMMLTQEGE